MCRRPFRYGIMTPWINSRIVADVPGFKSCMRMDASITIPVGEVGRYFSVSTNLSKQCIRSNFGLWNISPADVSEGGKLQFSLKKRSSLINRSDFSACSKTILISLSSFSIIGLHLEDAAFSFEDIMGTLLLWIVAINGSWLYHVAWIREETNSETFTHPVLSSVLSPFTTSFG